MALVQLADLAVAECEELFSLPAGLRSVGTAYVALDTRICAAPPKIGAFGSQVLGDWSRRYRAILGADCGTRDGRSRAIPWPLSQVMWRAQEIYARCP